MTAPTVVEPLTYRERQLLTFLAEGNLRCVMAIRLGCAESTVQDHLTRLFKKLGAFNAPNAVHIAHQRGLLGGAP